MFYSLQVKVLVKYMTMLFTVNTETLDPPAFITLGLAQPGHGAQTRPVLMKSSQIDWKYDMPLESETGLTVIPGGSEMQLLYSYFARTVKIVGVKTIVNKALRDFAWPGHAMKDYPVQFKYVITRIKAGEGCSDVDWSAVMLDHEGKPSCSMTIKQRWYV
jgi:hypothetical protein